jgi:hypothetical protein
MGSWYPIALAWHDFDCDYFAMISDEAKNRARSREIRFLFYYHEGDHPGRIKSRFDHWCVKNDLPQDCYLLISANSSADHHDGCYYFNDHEYFLSYINRRQIATAPNIHARPYEFTALNRIHKWWRATVMSDLHHHGVLDHSQWSYNTTLTEDDRPEDNPIRTDCVHNLCQIMQHFLDRGPYVCDCSDIDDIIVFREDGSMSVSKVSDKAFVGKGIIHISIFILDTISKFIACLVTKYTSVS